MAGQWMRGVVKEVVSGDTVVVMGQPRGGPPPEKRITLASLIAPRLGRRDGSTPEEPFAWQSREFLRTKAIGQPCVFRVDYTLENIPGREFGSVFIGEANENLAMSVVAAGWSKIRTPGGQQSPYYDELAAAQQAAEEQGLGLWTKDEKAVAEAVRTVPGTSGDQSFDAQGLLDKVGKGKPLPALVEQVPNGSTLRVTLLHDYSYVTVMVCGIQAPSMGRRPQPAGEGENGAPAVESSPDPFAPQAKHFTETRALNREVRVVLEGIDKYNNLFGTVMYPEGAEARDLGEALVKQGYAKTVEWGLNMMIQGSFKLREAERAAKQQRVGMWKNWTPPVTATTKLSDKFVGTVAEVVSGDCLVIRDHSSGVERRVTLSSIRAPRLGRKEDKSEDYAVEAKEFLRQRLIGQEVSVSMEYTRKLQAAPGAEAAAAANGAADRTMAFGSVTITEKDKAGQSRTNNVAELLLVRGLAKVVNHRTDEERSAHYEALLEAEQNGKKGKKGLWSSKEAPAHHVNDVSVPGAASRAKQYLPFFQRGRHNAVVDYVLSGHRLKLYVPKEGVTVAFSPSGVRCPQRGMPASARGPATVAEPYWEEAYNFTRQQVLQRDVEVEVETMDRGGTFLGTLRLSAGGKPLGLGAALLEAGLAKLHPNFDPDRVPGGRELAAAEAKARNARLKVWENYVAPVASVETGTDEEHPNGGASGQRESTHVTVTEVRSAAEFYVQMVDEPRVAWLEEQLKALGLSDAQLPKAPLLSAGATCLARYTLDDKWYRALVEKAYTSDPVKPEYNVVFIDFGNRERVDGSRIQPMEPSLAAVPPQAHQCTLAYLKVPSVEDELGQDAAHLLSDFAGGGKPLVAFIEQRERPAAVPKSGLASPGRLHVVLCEKERAATKESANAELLLAGLARVQKPHGRALAAAADVVNDLVECEERARKKRVGMFVYGDPGDEEEEEAEKPRAWGRR
ncbi:hypothetical protein WJX72_007851 [[Myrmecia] bisecta]|uniref:Ribonuclease n=1 Tax=[Myrmecia] bisecta TaxID=41462 RepID=A0AAW1PXC0_9CHLO